MLFASPGVCRNQIQGALVIISLIYNKNRSLVGIGETLEGVVTTLRETCLATQPTHARVECRAAFAYGLVFLAYLRSALAEQSGITRHKRTARFVELRRIVTTYAQGIANQPGLTAALTDTRA